MKLWILLLTVSMCRAQFSIQGPSDGHRQAAGLKVSQEKGVEYIPHKDSIQAGGFSIQGATDGNSNFKIQGASDGNSNFHIQGATDANANFQIQGPTTGGSNTYIHGAYDANQARAPAQPQPQRQVNHGGGRSLQYKDPSGYRISWKSSALDQQQNQYQQQQQQYQQQRQQYQQPAQPQYSQPQAAPVRRPVHRQPAPQAPAPQYTQTRPLGNAPDRIKQLLLFQQQIPYVNSIPEQYRYDGLANAQAQAEKFREEYPKQVLQQVQSNRAQPEPQAPARYRSKPARGPSRTKRQAPQYQQQQQQQHGQPQYRRIAQPPADPVPNYSTNLPNSIQQILKFQAQIPYDIIANRIIYKPDKPYIPQPVQQPAQQQQQQPALAHAPAQPSQYQSQLLTYNQNQGQAYGQTQGPVYPNYNQGYAQGQQANPIRPVTERQYKK